MSRSETVKAYLSTVGVSGLFVAANAKLQGNESVFEIRRSDLKHPVFLRVPSTDVLAYREVILNEEYKVPPMISPKFIVDAGANIGLTSVYFASKFPDARIIAIEPEEKNFQLLLKNVAPYPGVVPINAALWSHTGSIQLIDPRRGNWGFQTVAHKSDKATAETGRSIAAVTVGNLLEQYGVEQIDILKMDIEGAELEVFRESSAWIGRVNLLIVELHERLKPGCLRSFYNGSNGFDKEWQQGENTWLMRHRT
jgi:FkbM family methyltransferase